MNEVLSTALLLIQIAVIIGFSRLTAIVFRRIGQPAAVGEMVAGIALGPTLFGWLAPEAYARLFPVASLGFLSALSQSGLVIFTFLIGVRSILRNCAARAGSRSSLATSALSCHL